MSDYRILPDSRSFLLLATLATKNNVTLPIDEKGLVSVPDVSVKFADGHTGSLRSYARGLMDVQRRYSKGK